MFPQPIVHDYRWLFIMGFPLCCTGGERIPGMWVGGDCMEELNNDGTHGNVTDFFLKKKESNLTVTTSLLVCGIG